MNVYENGLVTEFREKLSALKGATLNAWESTLPMDDSQRQTSFGYVRLRTSVGTLVLCLFEALDFPDVGKAEILGQQELEERVASTPGSLPPDEWHSCFVGKVVRDVRLYTDIATEVRGSPDDETIVHDLCGVAFIFGDEALLLEKTYAMSEFWEISRQPAGDIRLTGRPRRNIVSVTL